MHYNLEYMANWQTSLPSHLISLLARAIIAPKVWTGAIFATKVLERSILGTKQPINSTYGTSTLH